MDDWLQKVDGLWFCWLVLTVLWTFRFFEHKPNSEPTFFDQAFTLIIVLGWFIYGVGKIWLSIV